VMDQSHYELAVDGAEVPDPDGDEQDSS